MVVVDMLHRILDSLSEALSKNIYGYLYMCLWIFLSDTHCQQVLRAKHLLTSAPTSYYSRIARRQGT